MTKYIFVTGGVISGLGKGVTSASIGSILQMLGENNITIKKLDPYLNIDPGTMNPLEHGEVFVTDDGTETDLDLGYYERFLELKTSRLNSTSSGKLFKSLLEKERLGDFLGETVQMIPHFTNLIKEFILSNEKEYDYIICEIGGSIGDIEAMAFYEAIRQLKNDVGIDNTLFIHLTYLVYYSTTKELKTKPTQNAVKELQQNGIFPDILICRTEHPISDKIRKKLSLHVNLPIQNIIQAIDVPSIYQIPSIFLQENVHNILSEKFNINNKLLNTNKWTTLNNKISTLKKSITIGILGKYVELNDSYKSLLESLFHAGLYHNHKINIQWINARENITNTFNNVQGVIIPGGFGSTGIENIMNHIRILRLTKKPTLGICLGMQLMVIEYFRSISISPNAGSSEFEGYSPNIVSKLNNKNIENYGGTMRLGSHSIILMENTKVKDIYSKSITSERHRHRYEVNSLYTSTLREGGMIVSGISEENKCIEIIDLEENDHPWYIGCQFHPEYNSSPFNPHPLFISFIQQCIHP